MNDKLIKVFSILEKTYYKILKIHPATDSYEVIKVMENENDLYHNLHAWCENFVKSGNIFQEDIGEFLSFFDNLTDGKTLYYRRKVNNVWRWAFMETFADTDSVPEDPTIYLYIRNSDNDFVSRISIQKELEYKSEHDTMTGLKNRTAYDSLYFNSGEHDNVGIIYCDLNKLKHYNDTYGHDAGDTYIRTFADCLRENFRNDDCYRIGGDEFVIVLFNISLVQLQEKVISLFTSITKRNVSSAIGYSWSEHTSQDNFSLLVKETEVKMYENKHER